MKSRPTTETATIELCRADCDITLEVDYEYIPASRGSRDRYGLQMEPDESAYCNVLAARNLETGEEVTLTRNEEERVAESCLCEAERIIGDAKAEAAERRWEDAREERGAK